MVGKSKCGNISNSIAVVEKSRGNNNFDSATYSTTLSSRTSGSVDNDSINSAITYTISTNATSSNFSTCISSCNK